MKHSGLFAFIFCLLFSQPGYGEENNKNLRLISLSPSITEMIFALGAGDSLVGVTDYCLYPEEAKKITRVGGYMSPGMEAMLALRPDYVIVLEEHAPLLPTLNSLGLKVITLEHRSLAGLVESFRFLGKSIGKEKEGARLADDFLQELEAIKNITKNLKHPETLLILYRDYSVDSLSQVYCAGTDKMYNELLQIAGGKNIYTGALPYPVLSAEGIASLNPEVVIELTYKLETKNLQNMETILRDGHLLSRMRAAANDKIYSINSDYAYIPGPRFIQLARDLARILHPEYFK